MVPLVRSSRTAWMPCVAAGSVVSSHVPGAPSCCCNQTVSRVVEGESSEPVIRWLVKHCGQLCPPGGESGPRIVGITGGVVARELVERGLRVGSGGGIRDSSMRKLSEGSSARFLWSGTGPPGDDRGIRQ